MKISDCTLEDVASYLRLPDDANRDELYGIMDSAQSYIISYTGLPEGELDRYDDLTLAYLLLCQDLYDKRTTETDAAAVNRTLDTILGMHARNLV